MPETRSQVKMQEISDPSLAQKPSIFPGIFPTIGWIVLYFVLQLICTAIFIAVDAVSGGTQIADAGAHKGLAVLWGIVASAIIQLSLMFLYLRKDNRFKKIGLDSFGTMPLARTFGLAFILVVGAMLFNFLYAHYVIPGIGMQEEMAKMLASIPRTPVNIIAGFFAFAIAAPLVEELLFRGFLQNALTRFVPVWAAILLSSFAFALVHLQPYAIPGLMSLSIAFGYLYHRTGSLRTNILLHILNNTAALLLTQAVV
ncbi:CPBP family glutamic-type intramembrane protease [Sphingorhabdus profundilacus]|uniref:CPBP family glutamic-type intramembrane protease n=1 Tax=Sphingorhabdus profundilacus TaxID=2509718 RepID=UPI00136542D5